MHNGTTSFRSVERIDFDRLTGATLDLSNLPQVTMVEIGSQLDNMLPCDMITGNFITVTVAVGVLVTQCVSINDL